MRKKHRRTLELIFERPTQSGIRWSDIESLLWACGAAIMEGSGSRVGIELNGVRAVVHRPHPQPEVGRATGGDIRDFLTEAGVTP